MNSVWIRRTFVTFHVTLAVVVFIESVLAVIHALHSTTQSHLGTILPYFAGLEAVAALMLLIPWTLRIGGGLLLAIFAAALVVHGPADQMALFVYAAGVIFLMVHGSAYSRPLARSDNGVTREE